jgi:hypothetical protein
LDKSEIKRWCGLAALRDRVVQILQGFVMAAEEVQDRCESACKIGAFADWKVVRPDAPDHLVEVVPDGLARTPDLRSDGRQAPQQHGRIPTAEAQVGETLMQAHVRAVAREHVIQSEEKSLSQELYGNPYPPGQLASAGMKYGELLLKHAILSEESLSLPRASFLPERPVEI